MRLRNLTEILIHLVALCAHRYSVLPVFWKFIKSLNTSSVERHELLGGIFCIIGFQEGNTIQGHI